MKNKKGLIPFFVPLIIIAFSCIAYSEIAPLTLEQSLEIAKKGSPQIASAKNAEKVAYDSRNAAMARADKSEAELDRLKASAASIDGRYETYLLAKSKDFGMTPSRVIELALDTYQSVENGNLVPASYLPKLNSVTSETLTQLNALASRTRTVLRFKKFLPKRYVKQAEATLAALNSALNYL